MSARKKNRPKRPVENLIEMDRIAKASKHLFNAWTSLEHIDEFSSERKVIQDIRNKLMAKVSSIKGS